MGHAKQIILILAILASSAWAQDGSDAEKKKPAFAVDETDVSVGWGGCFRPGQWAPVNVTVQNGLKKPFDGVLILRAQQDELTEMEVRHPITLTPDMPLPVPLAMKLSSAANECRMEIRDATGRRRWGRTFVLAGYGQGSLPAETVGPESVLIGVVGGGGFGLTALGGGAHGQADRDRPGGTPKAGRVFVKTCSTRGLPWDWTAYAPLDVLVLQEPDWDKLRPEQSRAIAEWVSNGGSLLIAPGSTGWMDAASPLAKLVPFVPGPASEVSVPPEVIKRWGAGAGAAGRVSLPFRAIPDHPGRGWTVTRLRYLSGFSGADGDATLWAAGPFGFGRVGVLACELAKLGPRQGSNTAPFWIERLNPLLARRTIVPGAYREDPNAPPQFQQAYPYGGGPYGAYGYGPPALGAAGPGTNAVLDHLLDIPELRPLSIWVVIGVLTALALLIGPVDYLVLKRLRRLPLTWVTSAACVVVFTAGAYYGVKVLRGSTVQVRAVSVVDGVKNPGEGLTGASSVWATTYSGIFAPAHGDYQLDRLGKRQWWSSVVPTSPESLRLYSRLDPTRQITCLQLDGCNLPVSVPISELTMQNLIATEPLSEMPFDVRLRRLGDGSLDVTIVNTSDVPIRGGQVRLRGNRVLRLGPVAGNTSKKFTGPTIVGDPWKRGDNAYMPGRFNGEPAYFAAGTLGRTKAIQEYLSRDGAVVCVVYEGAQPPFRLKGRQLDLYHLRMARLVVPVEQERQP